MKKIMVIGSGQMGSGIAQVAATSGFEVLLVDSQAAALEKARNGIEKSLAKLIEKGVLMGTTADILRSIHFSANLSDAKTFLPDMAIEAIVENLEVKEKLFRDLDALLPKGSILCSNTSSISITKLAAATKRPEKVMGMHFMNPVPLMKLVELIEGEKTSAETSNAVRAAAEKMGKTCVLSRDRAGFIINRILMPMINEAFIALDEKLASAEDIDTGMKLGTNQPMGPLALADYIGLDTCLFIMEVLHTNLKEEKYRPSKLLRQYVDSGKLGKKSGQGVYKY